MKRFRWNNEKNAALQKERGVSFEDVLAAMTAGGLLDVLEHPKRDRYPNQRIFVVRIEDYAFLVPFTEDGDEIFLKTIIPSRKATRHYLKLV